MKKSRSFVRCLRSVAVAAVAARALIARPRLWPTALRQAARFAPGGWWRRPPFLPLPAGGLIGFRSEAMYGDPGKRPEPEDVIVWLEWCRAQNRSTS
ncbi:MAG: hypothetical protein OXD37_05490 [Acidimicrobiaceae bacterium]|nr:hypothetical protein [Acidimicrobiaceae bacterium]